MTRPVCKECNKGSDKWGHFYELIPTGRSDYPWRCYRCKTFFNENLLKVTFSKQSTTKDDTGEGENPGGYINKFGAEYHNKYYRENKDRIEKQRRNRRIKNSINIAKQLTFRNGKKPSLIYCLKELGARDDEIRFGRLHEDLQNLEILDWAEHLYKEKLIKYHPDLHPNEWGKYSEYCGYLGEMINRVRRIIYGRL